MDVSKYNSTEMIVKLREYAARKRLFGVRRKATAWMVYLAKRLPAKENNVRIEPY